MAKKPRQPRSRGFFMPVKEMVILLFVGQFLKKFLPDFVCPFDSHNIVIVEYIVETDIFKIDGIFKAIKVNMK